MTKSQDYRVLTSTGIDCFNIIDVLVCLFFQKNCQGVDLNIPLFFFLLITVFYSSIFR